MVTDIMRNSGGQIAGEAEIRLGLALLLLAASVTGRDSTVTVSNGKVTVGKDDRCNVTIYNQTIYNAEGELPGLYYGLISYKCDQGAGDYVISKPRCFDCGVYCPQNDLLLTCSHFWFPFIMGSLIGVGYALGLAYIVKYFRDHYLPKIQEYFWDRRQARRRRKLEKIRAFLETEHKGQERPLQLEGREQEEPPQLGEGEPLEPREEEETQPRASAPPRSRKNSAVLMGALLASGYLQQVTACDRSLYIKSQNIVCEESVCREASAFLVTLENNMKACFTGPEGNQFALTLADFRQVVTYHYVYKTSSYKIETKAKTTCKNMWSDCWRGAEDQKGCRLRERHQDFEERNNITAVYGYDCNMVNKYYRWCTLGYVCTWFQWMVRPEGELYKVYKYNQRGFEIDFEVAVKDRVHTVTLSDRNMHVNTNLVVDSNVAIPLTIVSTLGTDHFFSGHLVKAKDNFYDADASDLNSVVKNRIGDFQIDSRGKASIDQNSIICRAEEDHADCVTTQPAVDVLLSRKHPKSFKTIEMVSDDVVKQKLSSHRSVTLTFSHNNLEAIRLSRPRCQMAVSYSYGCKECNQSPKVIISANSIFQEGMVLFESNCTFSQQYLSCSRVPQMMELLDDKKYCYIYMESLNITLNINIEYEFVGEVMFNPLIFGQGENFGSLLSSVTANPNFVDGIFKSFLFTSGVLLTIATTARVMGRLAIIKMSASVARDATREV